MYNLLLFLLLFDALILAIAVLLQAGQGGGLASLGGGAGTDMLMGGRQATTLLHKVTWWTAGIFLGVALILTIISSQGGVPRSVLEGNVPAPQPVQPTPLPLQTTPQQTTPRQTPPAPRRSPTPNR